jgi:hypothetical protein
MSRVRTAADSAGVAGIAANSSVTSASSREPAPSAGVPDPKDTIQAAGACVRAGIVTIPPP